MPRSRLSQQAPANTDPPRVVPAPPGMRIAILWTGHLRTYEKLFANHKQWLFDPLKADLFIHTWTLDESNTPTWWRKQPGPAELTQAERVHELYDSVGLKRLQIEDASQHNFCDPAYTKTNSASTVKYEHVVAMWYTWQAVWQLMQAYEQEQGFQYDLVVKGRPDVTMETTMDYNTKGIALGSWTRRLNGLRHPQPTWESCCDLAAYGPRQWMEVYCQLYEHRLVYANQDIACHAMRNTRYQIVPEGILARYLTDRQVPVNLQRIERKIHRLDGRVNGTPGFGK